jgi:hypothetical protein
MISIVTRSPIPSAPPVLELFGLRDRHPHF